MDCTIDIDNERYSPDERFMMYQHSGDTDDAPEEIRDAIMDAGKAEEAIEAPAGYWFVIMDNEVIISEFCPFRVEVESQ